LNAVTDCLAKEDPLIVAVALSPGMTDTDMQRMVREQPDGKVNAGTKQFFLNAFQTGFLHSADVPGAVAGWLALQAPKEISGKFVSWDDAQIKGWMAQK